MVHSAWTRQEIAARVAEDLPEDGYVNLGIGMPTLVAAQIPRGRDVIFHSENGILGLGPPPDGDIDPDVIDAGKNPATVVPGGCYMSHCDSFALIRGRHLDVSVMGAFEVSFDGDLANWSTEDGRPPAIGGAMDLAVGARRVWVMMTLRSRSGMCKLVPTCRYPLTAARVVDRVYTDLAVFELDGGRVTVRDRCDGVTIDDLKRLVGTAVAT